MKAYNFCNNCGKNGHLFHQCKNPITSLGIIAFRYTSHGFEYLMIRRKDTLGYVDFIRGKYPLQNKTYLLHILSEMTVNERSKLLNSSFDELWIDLWGEHIGIQYRGEERISKEKFNILKTGIKTESHEYDLDSLNKEVQTNWTEPEWGFPKGRRNYQERDLSCAIREFEEETGFNKMDISIVQNVIPFDEIFTGSNYKSYRHRYFLAFLDNKSRPASEFQKTEVSKLAWSTYKDALEAIRPYNLEKKEVLKRVNKLLKEYRLYS